MKFPPPVKSRGSLLYLHSKLLDAPASRPSGQPALMRKKLHASMKFPSFPLQMLKKLIYWV